MPTLSSYAADTQCLVLTRAIRSTAVCAKVGIDIALRGARGRKRRMKAAEEEQGKEESAEHKEEGRKNARLEVHERLIRKHEEEQDRKRNER
eukprot:3171730-Rhodomonas_salina.1